MARNATFKILIAYEAYERFAAIIRPQTMAERGAAPLKSQFDIEYGLGKSDWPDHPHLLEQSAKPYKVIN